MASLPTPAPTPVDEGDKPPTPQLPAPTPEGSTSVDLIDVADPSGNSRVSGADGSEHEKPAPPRSKYLPVDDKEAIAEKLPELNFRPFTLKTWYLAFLSAWLLACI